MIAKTNEPEPMTEQELDRVSRRQVQAFLSVIGQLGIASEFISKDALELIAEVRRLREELTHMQARYEAENEAYMDLFHQLSEYERKEIEAKNA